METCAFGSFAFSVKCNASFVSAKRYLIYIYNDRFIKNVSTLTPIMTKVLMDDKPRIPIKEIRVNHCIFALMLLCFTLDNSCYVVLVTYQKGVSVDIACMCVWQLKSTHKVCIRDGYVFSFFLILFYFVLLLIMKWHAFTLQLFTDILHKTNFNRVTLSFYIIYRCVKKKKKRR